MRYDDDPLDMNLDTVFFALTEAFERTRGQLGDERHAALVDLAARAKALFADDPDDSNGKTDEGIKLLYEIEAIVESVRRRRYRAGFREEG